MSKESKQLSTESPFGSSVESGKTANLKFLVAAIAAAIAALLSGDADAQNKTKCTQIRCDKIENNKGSAMVDILCGGGCDKKGGGKTTVVVTKRCNPNSKKCRGKYLIGCNADGKKTSKRCKYGCDSENKECKKRSTVKKPDRKIPPKKGPDAGVDADVKPDTGGVKPKKPGKGQKQSELKIGKDGKLVVYSGGKKVPAEEHIKALLQREAKIKKADRAVSSAEEDKREDEISSERNSILLWRVAPLMTFLTLLSAFFAGWVRKRRNELAQIGDINTNMINILRTNARGGELIVRDGCFEQAASADLETARNAFYEMFEIRTPDGELKSQYLPLQPLPTETPPRNFRWNGESGGSHTWINPEYLQSTVDHFVGLGPEYHDMTDEELIQNVAYNISGRFGSNYPAIDLDAVRAELSRNGVSATNIRRYFPSRPDPTPGDTDSPGEVPGIE